MVHSTSLQRPRPPLAGMMPKWDFPPRLARFCWCFGTSEDIRSTTFRPMARLIFGFVLFSMVFAQATIIPAINPLAVAPDFVLLLLFVVTLYTSLREGLVWLFLAGIVTDVLAMDPLGANGLALLPAVVLVEPARLPVFRANLLIPIVLVLVATMIHGLIQSLVRGIMPDITLLLQTLMHAVLFPFLYLILRWLD